MPSANETATFFRWPLQVVLHSDHGWQLSEHGKAIAVETGATQQRHPTPCFSSPDTHLFPRRQKGLWDKQTEFELATRVPLIIRAPWKPRSVGQHTTSFTELVRPRALLLLLAPLLPSAGGEHGSRRPHQVASLPRSTCIQRWHPLWACPLRRPWVACRRTKHRAWTSPRSLTIPARR